MICIIPMRSGSKRLKDKNIKELFGWPVFHYALQTAKESKLFDRIILAIDKEYINIVSRYMPIDAIVYIRKPENSKDKSTIYDLVKEVVEEFKIKDKFGCVLYSTSALTTKEHLRCGYKELKKGKYSCVFPIVKQEHELFLESKHYHLNTIQVKSNIYAKHGDAWFMFNIKKILESGSVIQDINGGIVLKDYEAQAVHTEEDFEDLEYKFKAARK